MVLLRYESRVTKPSSYSLAVPVIHYFPGWLLLSTPTMTEPVAMLTSNHSPAEPPTAVTRTFALRHARSRRLRSSRM